MIDLNQIYLGDCQELMQEIPDGSIDPILQDPPYNTTACKWEWDIMSRIDEFWAQWKRIIKPNGAIVMTASQPFTSKLVMSNLKMFKYEWIWDKKSVSNPQLAKIQPLKAHEDIVIFGSGRIVYHPQGVYPTTHARKKDSSTLGHCQRRAYTQTQTGYPKSILSCGVEHGLHPTQKPVTLFEYLIRTYTDEGDTVFDGFAGSGTTAVACLNTKRNYICVEKDFDYWYSTSDRVSKHTQI